MTEATAPKPEQHLFGLVRDKDGRPKIDDPENLHPRIADMLSPAERHEFGIPRPGDDPDDRTIPTPEQEIRT